MKTGVQVFVILLAGFMFSGCSKTDEITSETASNLVNRIKSPIEEARAVSAKAAATRDADLSQ